MRAMDGVACGASDADADAAASVPGLDDGGDGAGGCASAFGLDAGDGRGCCGSAADDAFAAIASGRSLGFGASTLGTAMLGTAGSGGLAPDAVVVSVDGVAGF